MRYFYSYLHLPPLPLRLRHLELRLHCHPIDYYQTPNQSLLDLPIKIKLNY